MGVEEAEKMSTSLGPTRMDVYSSWHHGVFGFFGLELVLLGGCKGALLYNSLSCCCCCAERVRHIIPKILLRNRTSYVAQRNVRTAIPYNEAEARRFCCQDRLTNEDAHLLRRRLLTVLGPKNPKTGKRAFGMCIHLDGSNIWKVAQTWDR